MRPIAFAVALQAMTPTVYARWEDHPPDAVLVDRTTIFGNPFPVEHPGFDGKAQAVERFRAWISLPEQEWLRARARELLRGRDLVCHCAFGTPCHAWTLLEIASAPE